MSTAAIQLVMAFVAAIGFGLLFNLRRDLILPAAVGGFLGWGIYLVAGEVIDGIFFPCLIASIFSAFFAEVFARMHHAPIAIFYIIVVIPLVPGRALFYTMFYATQTQWDKVAEFAFMTAEFALPIAFGVGIVWALSQINQRFIERRKQIQQ